MELMKGLVWTAVGVIGISFLTTSVSIAWRTIPALVGIIFCIVGGRKIHGEVTDIVLIVKEHILSSRGDKI